ncbi:TVP38/TMEM64 family protein [Streptomyces sp. JJ36]|uniref:TVP38/TMEM64 family protein n=1 Tax=Streptomyces sp. JJ36 TaxID=2736645 RepID=UPI001F2B684A|nr:TVP38/TMEM64 family protein [Streptomyces sp. JJ36]MCF6524354.1 TVP38/TMEM64 family protein [Streptomyces sp. JJ36]
MSVPAAQPVPAGFPARLVQWLLSPWSRLGLLLVLIGTAAAGMLLYEPQRFITGGLTAEFSGALAVLLFAGAYGACTLAFVPRPLLNLGAGALFGAQIGVGAALAGTVLGAALSFGMGRLLGQDALRPLLRKRFLNKADRQLSDHGFRSVLAIRLLPGVPFAPSNYAAAVSRMGWIPFLSATALGSLPNTAAYVVAGSRTEALTSPASIGAFAVIALSVLAGVVVAWRKRSRIRTATAPAAA